jgi:hypothetical protein
MANEEQWGAVKYVSRHGRFPESDGRAFLQQLVVAMIVCVEINDTQIFTPDNISILDVDTSKILTFSRGICDANHVTVTWLQFQAPECMDEKKSSCNAANIA